MKKLLSPLFLATILVSSCVVSEPILVSDNTTINASSTNKVNVFNNVSRTRLETTLGALSGKTTYDSSDFIVERGTVDGRAKTRQYLTTRLEAMGYKVEKHNYRKNGENIFVRLMADTPTDEYILAGAHLDSVKNAGANDNGTGSTAVMEAAFLLKDLKDRKVNIIFAWFDEEELGLIGSEAMARDFKRKGMKITSVHTIDMMGWDSDSDKYIEIERPDGNLWDYYQMVNKRNNINLPLRRTNSGSTDHVAFRAQGFASVGLCEEWEGGDTTPYYHKKTDTFETINFPILEAGTKLLTAVISDLSQGIAAPVNSRFVPHDKFPGRDRHFHAFE